MLFPWDKFAWDYQVSVEGVAAALGIIGGVITYIINSAKRWRSNIDKEREVGTLSVILTLLERAPNLQMSETELFDAYQNGESLALVQTYRAYQPHKITRLKLERLIRQLHLQRLIRLVDTETYTLDIDYYLKERMEREKESVAEQQIRAQELQIRTQELRKREARFNEEDKVQAKKEELMSVFSFIDSPTVASFAIKAMSMRKDNDSWAYNSLQRNAIELLLSVDPNIARNILIQRYEAAISEEPTPESVSFLEQLMSLRTDCLRRPEDFM